MEIINIKLIPICSAPMQYTITCINIYTSTDHYNGSMGTVKELHSAVKWHSQYKRIRWKCEVNVQGETLDIETSYCSFNFG